MTEDTSSAAAANTTTTATTTTPPAGAQQVSENPLDYLTMIIYVKRGVRTCDDLSLRAAKRLDIMVQDVDNIEGQKPAWLRGVPTVVLLPGREILTGTKAIEAVLAVCESGVQGAEGYAFCTPAASGASLGGDDLDGPASFASLFTCADDQEEASSGYQVGKNGPLPTGGNERYEDRSKEKVHATSLEDALRSRGGV